MVWAATSIAFLATALVIVALVYAFSAGNLPVAERLTRLWRGSAPVREVGFREKQTQKVQKVLGDVGKILPASTKTLSHTHRLMVRAGYRRPAGCCRRA